MKRFCSRIIYCAPEKILKQAVVEQNDAGIISDLFLINSRHSESSQTLLVDGVISAEPLSLKQHLAPEKFRAIQNTYNYIDLSAGFLSTDFLPEKKLLLDFGTNSIKEINELLKFSFPLLAQFFLRLDKPLFDILAACVYYPRLELSQPAELQQGVEVNLVQWKGFDLVNNRLTEKLTLTYLF